MPASPSLRSSSPGFREWSPHLRVAEIGQFSQSRHSCTSSGNALKSEFVHPKGGEVAGILYIPQLIDPSRVEQRGSFPLHLATVRCQLQQRVVSPHSLWKQTDGRPDRPNLSHNRPERIQTSVALRTSVSIAVHGSAHWLTPVSFRYTRIMMRVFEPSEGIGFPALEILRYASNRCFDRSVGACIENRGLRTTCFTLGCQRTVRAPIFWHRESLSIVYDCIAPRESSG